jgi:hypothetical protein
MLKFVIDSWLESGSAVVKRVLLLITLKMAQAMTIRLMAQVRVIPAVLQILLLLLLPLTLMTARTLHQQFNNMLMRVSLV